MAAEGLNGQEGAVIDGVPTRVPQVLEDAASIAISMAVLTHHLCDCLFFELSRVVDVPRSPSFLVGTAAPTTLRGAEVLLV